MHVPDTSSRDGESPSGKSYPQHCLPCSTTWTCFGNLTDERVKCIECGQKASSVAFFRWWVQEEFGAGISVEIEVPSELSDAVDRIVEATGRRREAELLELLTIRYEYVEERE